jgi:hypothetical protein
MILNYKVLLVQMSKPLAGPCLTSKNNCMTRIQLLTTTRSVLKSLKLTYRTFKTVGMVYLSRIIRIKMKCPHLSSLHPEAIMI